MSKEPILIWSRFSPDSPNEEAEAEDFNYYLEKDDVAKGWVLYCSRADWSPMIYKYPKAAKNAAAADLRKYLKRKGEKIVKGWKI